ncbi:16681_t:CDS:2, partial [Funneliformis geosporum]
HGRGNSEKTMVKEPISTEPDITPAIVKVHRRGGHGRGKDTGCENEGVIEASNKIIPRITDLLHLIEEAGKPDLDDDEKVVACSKNKKSGNFIKLSLALDQLVTTERPNILTMANQMTHAVNTSLDSCFVNMATMTV